MIIYSKDNNLTNAAFGKINTPIKMIIEHESDLLRKKGGICDWLFNVEKSNRFGETIVIQNEFNMFTHVAEGNGAESDTIEEHCKKFIEHVQFMKEFAISAEMMEDANYGIAAEAKRRAENFTRAYYKTINQICEHVLINGTSTTTTFAKASLDISAPDKLPLFCCEHVRGTDLLGYTQSNFFWGDIFNSGTNTRVPSTAVFEEALTELSVKLRNLQDENGEPTGYVADTIILPGNRPVAEMIAKKVCGSDGVPGSNYNDINMHYGNWNIIILPHWQTSDDRVMIMSSEANKALSGNMFFNRVPLTVSNWVDHHTGNYMWTGRCRFGVGFGSYKHIVMAIDSASQIEEATKL